MEYLVLMELKVLSSITTASWARHSDFVMSFE